MILLCTQTDSSWFTGLIQYFIAPFIVAALAYYLFGLRDEYKRRKKYSILGAELLSTLIEEVNTGKNIIEQTLNPESEILPNPLPRKSWNGISTIQDEILLRIFEVSNGISEIGFPAKEIRIHTKNYFEHIVTNWDAVSMTAVKGQDFKRIAYTMSSFYEATNNVLLMLKHVKDLLEKNAKKTFPK